MFGRILVLSLFIAGAAFGDEHPPIGFHVVDNLVFRGGRPSTDGSMGWLAHHGVHTVINLQGEGFQWIPGEKSSQIEDERQLADSFHLRYLHMPVSPGGELDAKEQRMVLDIVAQLEDPASTPVYVHCNVGADRTGIVVAAYRILHENCSYEQALREFVKLGAPWSTALEKPQFSFLQALAAHPEQFGRARSGLRCSLAK
jgi:protein tyrosine/serine phosphatase